MEPITRKDILDIAEYERIRPEFRKHVVEMKKNRRLPVGDRMTLVFENRDTVRFQIQEMMRVERMVDENAIRHEIETYNQLIPGNNELSATMLIEIQEYGKIKEHLDALVGLTRDCVFLEVNGERVAATFDEDQSEEGRISAVQYIRFHLTGKMVEDFRDVEKPARIVVEHPNYSNTADITGDIRRSLIGDLT